MCDCSVRKTASLMRNFLLLRPAALPLPSITSSPSPELFGTRCGSLQIDWPLNDLRFMQMRMVWSRSRCFSLLPHTHTQKSGMMQILQVRVMKQDLQPYGHQYLTAQDQRDHNITYTFLMMSSWCHHNPCSMIYSMISDVFRHLVDSQKKS